MKSYSTHRRRLKGPIQINLIRVSAPSIGVVTTLWGKSAERPLAKIEGAGTWCPPSDQPPVTLNDYEFCGYDVEPKNVLVDIQTLYCPLETQ